MKNYSFMDKVIISCWIVAAGILIFFNSLRTGSRLFIPICILLFQLIQFTRTMRNTAIINRAIYDLGYDNIFYRKIRMPAVLKKLCYGYDEEFGIHVIVLSMQYIEIALLLNCFVYASIYVWDCWANNSLNSYGIFSPNKYEITLIVIIVLSHIIIRLYFACLIDRLEKKNNCKEKQISLKKEPLSCYNTKKTVSYMKQEVALLKSLKKYCHKYKNKYYLLHEDIPNLEKLLLEYFKYFDYDISKSGKRENIITIRKKDDGKIVFQSSIKQ